MSKEPIKQNEMDFPNLKLPPNNPLPDFDVDPNICHHPGNPSAGPPARMERHGDRMECPVCHRSYFLPAGVGNENTPVGQAHEDQPIEFGHTDIGPNPSPKKKF